MTCIFCQIQQDALVRTQHFFLVWDIDPIQTGHLLIISKRHLDNLQTLSDEEVLDLFHLQQHLIQALHKQAPDIELSFVCNNGQLMDEGTHLHVHVIPRQVNDGFWETIHPKIFNFDNQNWLKHFKDEITK